MNLFLDYVVIAGTVTAGAKMARGVIHAVHKIGDGKNGEGLWKFAGCMLAPATDASRELLSLGAEGKAAAKDLLGKVKERHGRKCDPAKSPVS